MSEEILKALRDSTKGLFYPSETDSPFEVVCWRAGGELNAENLEILTRPKSSRKARKVVQVTLENFFAELTDSEDSAKFKNLQTILADMLSNTSVFRMGIVKVDIYIVGENGASDWIGLHTLSVET